MIADERPVGSAPHGEDDRRLKTIVGDLAQHGERLMKAELALGINELQRHVEDAKSGLKNAAIIGAMYYASYLTLLAALVFGLSVFLPAWASALIVGVLAGGGAYAFSQREIHAVKSSAHSVSNQMSHSIQRAQHR